VFYEFGSFRLDPEKHRLQQDAEIVSLTPKAIEILRVLIEHRGQLVDGSVLSHCLSPAASIEKTIELAFPCASVAVITAQLIPVGGRPWRVIGKVIV
jgi:hypothetical protein